MIDFEIRNVKAWKLYRQKEIGHGDVLVIRYVALRT